MATTAQIWSERTETIAGLSLHLLQGGDGPPAVVLHHSTGSLGWLPFYDALAEHFLVLAPDLPGWGESERPAWAREPRDVAILINRLLDGLLLEGVTLIGTGFGGFVAAEMATMTQSRLRALILVGAAGLQPPQGEILDQIMLDHEEYVRVGFRDDDAYRAIFDEEAAQELRPVWDFGREMAARLTWRPYMFNPRLPHLLPEVQTPCLLVWGENDRVVPLSCGERYAQSMPNARLEIVPQAGHLVELEEPQTLATMIGEYVKTVRPDVSFAQQKEPVEG